jgi:hypothetical protein
MSSGIPDPSPLDASLRRLRYSALLAVAACAAGIALHSFRAEEHAGDVERGFVMLALALAGISILARRSVPRSSSPRSFVGLQVTSNLAAVALGILGAWLAVTHDHIQSGLLYNLAAVLLLLRPPPRLVVAPPRPRS